MSINRIIVAFDQFDDMYLDLLPWLDDVNLEELVNVLIDDLNGIARIATNIGIHNGKADFTEMTHTLNYLCRQTFVDVNMSALTVLKTAISSILRQVLRVVVRFGYFADCVYSVQRCVFSGPHGSIKNLVLMLDVHYVHDYNTRINELVGKLGYDILNTFSGNVKHKASRQRPR